MKKQLCYIFMGIFLFSCGQQKKGRTLPQDDQIQKITIYQKPKIMNDTLKPYLFVPTTFIANKDIINKSYYVAVKTGNSQLDFRVGDVPVSLNLFWGEVTNKSGRRISPHVPINSCILKSGTYKITAKIYPRYGQTALDIYSYLEMEGYYRKSGDWDNTYPMFNIEMPSELIGTHIGNYTRPYQGYPYFELATEIKVEVPYSVEGWSNSVNLKDVKEEHLKQELQQSYDEIREIIARKDVNEFKKLIQEREDLLGTVYYLSDIEKENRINKLLTIIEDDNFDIAPYPKEAQLLFFAEGRMVTLVDPINREGIIRLVNKSDPKDIISLDFRLHRKREGQKLSVI